MPCFSFLTNVAAADVPNTLAGDFVDILHTVLGVPKQNLTIIILPDQIMRIKEDGETAAFCELIRFNVKTEENATLADALSRKIEEVLSVPSKRILIRFRETIPDNVAGRGLMVPELRAMQN